MATASITAVRAALKLSESTDAAIFTSLLDGGKVICYKSAEKARQKYGSKEVQYPAFGKKQAYAALGQVQSPKELQDICLRDLPEARAYFDDRLQYFVPRDRSDFPDGASEEEAGMHTIEALVNENSDITKVAVTFPCETLDKMCANASGLPENLLHSTMTTCTVLPKSTLLPLHHSNEGTTITTLLVGSIVWIIWPPTPRNIETLRGAYTSFVEDFDESKLNVASHLEGGVTFVQTVGFGIRIPPFSIMIGLATTTSAVASRTQVTVENFISMLSKLPLLKAWFQTEVYGVAKQSRFTASILHWLDLMLNGDPNDERNDKFKLPRTKDGLLGELLAKWDAIKDDLAALMGPADSNAIELIWEDFLVNAVGRECRICQVRVDSKQKRMMQHFVTKHWAMVKETQLAATSKYSGANDARNSDVVVAHGTNGFQPGEEMELEG